MKIKTAALIGPALDWAVAQCEMMREDYRDRGLLVHRIGYGQPMPPYSTDWSQGGPIIEREWLDITSWPNESDEEQRWQCHQYDAPNPYQAVGPTPLIAAMRCFVASRLGDKIEIPEELL